MKTLLLLHGALGAASQFGPLVKILEKDFQVLTLDFSGHGGRPFSQNFDVQSFVQETLAFLDEQNLAQADIFGYSMGGYVALCLAHQAPERVGKIMTLATKFDWSPAIAERETKMLDPEKIEAKVPAFAAALSQRHAPNDWKVLLRKTAGLMHGLGEDNLLKVNILEEIKHPVLVCLGDSDTMISMEETSRAAEALPNGRLKIFEQIPHPFEKVDLGILGLEIKAFFE